MANTFLVESSLRADLVCFTPDQVKQRNNALNDIVKGIELLQSIVSEKKALIIELEAKLEQKDLRINTLKSEVEDYRAQLKERDLRIDKIHEEFVYKMTSGIYWRNATIILLIALLISLLVPKSWIN